MTVADTSDSVPDFAKAVYTVEVAENAKPGDTVFTMNAGEGPFKYTLISQLSITFFHFSLFLRLNSELILEFLFHT